MLGIILSVYDFLLLGEYNQELYKQLSLMGYDILKPEKVHPSIHHKKSSKGGF